MANDQSIEIRISAKNLTKEAFEDARKQIAGLKSDTDKAGASVASTFGSAIPGAFGMVTAAAAIVASAIGAVAAGVVELAKHGAEINDVRENFETLNHTIGNDSRQVISTLSSSVDGMISRFDLMKSTNQALSQGLKASNNDFRVIGEGARVLSERIGGDTKTAYDTLIQAMASGRTMRLKEIGLNIDETQAIKDHARALGVDASELNEFGQKAAKQQAVLAELNRILAEGGRATMDFGDTWQSLKTRFTDFVDDFASAIAQSKVLGVALESVGDIMTTAFGGDTSGLISTVVHWIEKGALTLVEWGRTGISAGKVIAQAFGTVATLAGGAATAISGLFTGIAMGVEKTLELLSKVPGVGDALKGVTEQARIEVEGFKLITSELADGTKSAFEMAQGTGVLFDKLDKLGAGLATTSAKMTAAMSATDAHTESIRKNSSAHQGNHGEILSTNKLLDEYNKKVHDLASNLRAAAQFGAPVEFIAKQFGSAIGDVVEQASILGQKVPTLIRDAFLKISLKGADAQMVKQVEEIQKDLETKTKQGIDRRNAAFTKNIDAEVEAERNAADIRFRLTANDFEYQKRIIREEQQAKKDALDETGANYKEALAAIDHETDARMAEAAKSWADHLAEMDAATDSWRNLTIRWIGSIPDLLKQAFTGGGGLGGALKALVSGAGGDIGGKLFSAGGLFNGLGNKLTSGMSDMFGQSVGAAFGLALPGIGSAIGALAGPLISKVGGLFKKMFGGPSQQELQGRDVEKQFQDQFGSFDKMMAAVGKAYEATGKSAQQAQADVKALMDAEKQGGDAAKAAIDKINQAFDQQKKDEADLNQAIKDYGFSIEELGPKMRKQQLTEQAVKLENDFRLLVNSGIDVGDVIEHMSGKLNDYLNLSIRTGSEVPAEMKPIIEKMIEMGKWTDENGNKITSLDQSGLTFSETMTQGFDRIVKALGDVVAALGGVKGGIDAIPTEKTIKITTRYEDVHSSRNEDEPPAFASEAYVRRPTLAVIGDVAGGEFVLKPSTIKKIREESFNAGAASASASAAPVDLSPLKEELQASKKELTRLRNDFRNMAGSLERAVRDGLLAAR